MLAKRGKKKKFTQNVVVVSSIIAFFSEYFEHGGAVRLPQDLRGDEEPVLCAAAAREIIIGHGCLDPGAEGGQGNVEALTVRVRVQPSGGHHGTPVRHAQERAEGSGPRT